MKSINLTPLGLIKSIERVLEWYVVETVTYIQEPRTMIGTSTTGYTNIMLPER